MNTLDQLFGEFIRECSSSLKLREETIRGYKNVFRMFRKYMPGITVDMLSPRVMTEFFEILDKRDRIVGRDKIIKNGIGSSTVYTYRMKLNVFFKWMKVNDSILSNPFDKMNFIRPMYDDLRWLSKEEIEKIISAIVSFKHKSNFLLKRNLLIIYIALFCGLRKGEIVALQLRDIDLAKKTIIVRGETSKSKMDRVLPMNHSLCLQLEDYLEERRKRNVKIPYLLVSDHPNTRFGANGLKHLASAISERSGVKFHFHRLRHTFAVNYTKQNPDVSELRQLMGHRDIRMTAIYLRCLPMDRLRENVEYMSIDNLA